MRQGFEPNRPQKAAMANAAMSLLADAAAKLEVRSEAARALGLMQIGTAVSKYNYPLIAHAAGQLAAELGNRIATGFTANQDKAKYLTRFLDRTGLSGIRWRAGGPRFGIAPCNRRAIHRRYIQNVFDLVKPVVQVDDRSALSRPAAGQGPAERPALQGRRPQGFPRQKRPGRSPPGSGRSRISHRPVAECG